MRPRGVKRLFAFSSRTRDEVRTDIRDEFQFHLDMRVDDLMRDGLSEADARAQAAREFGNQQAGATAIARQDDSHRAAPAASRPSLGEIKQDALIALRLLGRSPGFAAVAILTLALGIGANTAIFSALDAVLLRPLPYPAPDRLVEVFERLENGSQNSTSPAACISTGRSIRRSSRRSTILDRVTYNLRGSGTPERLQGIAASHDLLQRARRRAAPRARIHRGRRSSRRPQRRRHSHRGAVALALRRQRRDHQDRTSFSMTFAARSWASCRAVRGCFARISSSCRSS